MAGEFDAIAEAQKTLPASETPENVWKNVRQPEMFRQFFNPKTGYPDYASMPDEDITSNVDRLYEKHYLAQNPPSIPRPSSLGPDQSATQASVPPKSRAFSLSSVYGGEPEELNPVANAGLTGSLQLGEDLKGFVPGIIHGGATPMILDAMKKKSLKPLEGLSLFPFDANNVSEFAGRTGANLIFGAGLGKIASAAGAPLESEAEPNTTPTATQTLKLRSALRPGKTSEASSLRFPQSLSDAWRPIQEQISERGLPESVSDFLDYVKSAKQRVWQNYTDLLNKAQAARPPIRGLLPPAPAEIDTGVQGTTGTKNFKGAIPATDRQIPQRYPGDYQNPYEGSQAELNGPPRTEPQYLSGGAHPELSGQLTNPATLITRDPNAIRTTRDSLATLVNDDSFASRHPSEQAAMRAQLHKLNELATPGPTTFQGPSISGDMIADAIEASVRPRGDFLNSPAVQQVRAVADMYRGRRVPLTQAEEFLQDANYESEAWWNAAFRDPHGPQRAVSAAAEANSIKSQLYDQIDKLAETNPGAARQLKHEYGGLTALGQFAASRVPVAERPAPMNVTDVMGAMASGALHSPLPFAISKVARHMNSADFLLRSGLKPPSDIPRIIGNAAKVTGAGTAAASAVGSFANSVADDGATHYNPQTGERIRWNVTMQKWVPLEHPRSKAE